MLGADSPSSLHSFDLLASCQCPFHSQSIPFWLGGGFSCQVGCVVMWEHFFYGDDDALMLMVCCAQPAFYLCMYAEFTFFGVPAPTWGRTWVAWVAGGGYAWRGVQEGGQAALFGKGNGRTINLWMLAYKWMGGARHQLLDSCSDARGDYLEAKPDRAGRKQGCVEGASEGGS